MAIQQLKGLNTVIGNIKELEVKIPRKIAVALYQEALTEQAESMKRTPVDTGTLRNTHETGIPYYKGDTLIVDIQVGGPAAPYAVTVHEDLDMFHTNGHAKFLESVILESAPHMLSRLANRMKLNAGDL